MNSIYYDVKTGGDLEGRKCGILPFWVGLGGTVQTRNLCGSVAKPSELQHSGWS
jgi:hypothetical protein